MEQTLGYTWRISQLPQLYFDMVQWNHPQEEWDHHSWLEGEESIRYKQVAPLAPMKIKTEGESLESECRGSSLDIQCFTSRPGLLNIVTLYQTIALDAKLSDISMVCCFTSKVKVQRKDSEGQILIEKEGKE